VDLNADIGEGGKDDLLLPYVDRASIACGGHYGDEASMRQALSACRRHGVLPGAHPGYPDRKNFGRQPWSASDKQIAQWVEQQVRDLGKIAMRVGLRLFHVKPHGALYNQAATDSGVSAGLLRAMQELQGGGEGLASGMSLLVLARSPLVDWARAARVAVLEEGFVDRAYLPDGRLVPRSQPGAVLESWDGVFCQARALGRGEPVLVEGGGALLLSVDTLCLHGDNPGAFECVLAAADGLERLCPVPRRAGFT
jgi:UPF0271 protein